MKLILISAVLALDPSRYPLPFKIPPVNQQWSDSFLAGKNIPILPLTATGVDAADWTEDITYCPSPDDWAITIDDGTSAYSRNLTAEFAKINGKATFFVIGMQVLQFPDELKELADAGHQIGIHTWSHRPLTTLTNDQIVSEIVWTAKIIKEVTGLTPKYVRSPYGDIDPRVREILRAMGLIHTVWNRDTFDWQVSTNQTNPTNIVSAVNQWTRQRKSRTGTMSLHHEIYADSASALVESIHLISAASYTLKTVADCLNDKSPYDNTFLEKIVGLPEVARTTVVIPESKPLPTFAPVGASDKLNSMTARLIISIIALV